MKVAILAVTSEALWWAAEGSGFALRLVASRAYGSMLIQPRYYQMYTLAPLADSIGRTHTGYTLVGGALVARSKPRYQPVLDNAFYDLCLDMDTDVFAVETWCVACVSAAIYAKLGKTEEAATCSRVATKISLRWPQLPQLVVGVQLELG